MRVRLLLPLFFVVVAGCAASDFRGNEFKIGSATSKNVFLDASQFANRTVKLRLRNSSGDPSIVYAGDMRERRGQVMDAVQDRLARVVSNLI